MRRFRNSESGNAVLIVLAVLVVVAVGAMVYLSGMVGGRSEGEDVPVQAAEGETGPNNPVVATVNGDEIHREEVFTFIAKLPENLRVVPMDQLYPMALEQVISNRIIEDKVETASLENDPEVRRQLEQAKEQIVRAVFVQKEVEKRITDKKLKEAYEAYKANFPKTEEVKARHILVKDKATADEVIGKLKEGADFKALAKEYSTDATAESGGDLGYFVKKDVVPEFGEAVFAMKKGSTSEAPVQSPFGYHVIKLEDKRVREPASFEESKSFLEASLRRNLLDSVVREWREDAAVVRYDINGKPLEPAAGGEEARPMVPTTGGDAGKKEEPAEAPAAEQQQPAPAEEPAQPEAQ